MKNKHVRKKTFRAWSKCFVALFLVFTMMNGLIFRNVYAAGTRTATYEYDDLNRIKKVTYEDGAYTTYEYDANGNIVSQENYEVEKSEEDGSSNSGNNNDNGNTQNPGNEVSDGTTGGISDSTSESSVGITGSNSSSQTTETMQNEKIHKDGMTAKSKNAVYKIISVKHKTAEFQKMNNKKSTSCKIPKTVKIDGVAYKVTKIADKAFKGNKKIKKVTIEKNITSIGKQAFYGCKKLKKITVRTTKLKAIGKKALKGIHEKAVIKVPRKKYAKYKNLFRGKGQAKTVKIKK